MTKPCPKCPWAEKGQPDISPEVRAAAEGGSWFCCHVNMGTCFGAQGVSRNAQRLTDSIAQSKTGE